MQYQNYLKMKSRRFSKGIKPGTGVRGLTETVLTELTREKTKKQSRQLVNIEGKLTKDWMNLKSKQIKVVRNG